MGRRKLADEAPMVGNKKKMMKAFNKKKSYIMKKTYELSTLCDIQACVIIYGPNNDEPPCVWPEEPQGFNSILARYMHTSSEERTKRASTLPSMSKKLSNTEGFRLDDGINNLSGEQLMGLASHLNSKLDIVNSRIDVMKKSIIQYPQCQNQGMIETIQQRVGFYNIINNNNVNVGDYMGRNMMNNGVTMYYPNPLACYNPRVQLPSIQPHQSYTPCYDPRVQLPSIQPHQSF